MIPEALNVTVLRVYTHTRIRASLHASTEHSSFAVAGLQPASLLSPGAGCCEMQPARAPGTLHIVTECNTHQGSEHSSPLGPAAYQECGL